MEVLVSSFSQNTSNGRHQCKSWKSYRWRHGTTRAPYSEREVIWCSFDRNFKLPIIFHHITRNQIQSKRDIRSEMNQSTTTMCRTHWEENQGNEEKCAEVEDLEMKYDTLNMLNKGKETIYKNCWPMMMERPAILEDQKASIFDGRNTKTLLRRTQNLF